MDISIIQAVQNVVILNRDFREVLKSYNKERVFVNIAPLKLSSSGKGKDVATKQGNRRLQATIYFLAIQMGTPRNPVVRAYYEKRKSQGKTSHQALICISRRLISIIYGMLKNGTEYQMPVVESSGENI